ARTLGPHAPCSAPPAARRAPASSGPARFPARGHVSPTIRKRPKAKILLMVPESSIFKAYDIPGLSPSQIDGEVARRVGRAFIDYLGARRIAVGHDMRASSPEIAEGFIRGVRSQGTAVLDVGTVGTDMLYFAVRSEER